MSVPDIPALFRRHLRGQIGHLTGLVRQGDTATRIRMVEPSLVHVGKVSGRPCQTYTDPRSPRR